MSTEFTSWSDLRTAIKNAIADYVAGDPVVGEYYQNGRRLAYRSIDDLKKLLQLTYDMENIESAGDPSSRRSFGVFRRFR